MPNLVVDLVDSKRLDPRHDCLLAQGRSYVTADLLNWSQTGIFSPLTASLKPKALRSPLTATGVTVIGASVSRSTHLPGRSSELHRSSGRPVPMRDHP
jgi:hypothetical protein